MNKYSIAIQIIRQENKKKKTLNMEVLPSKFNDESTGFVQKENQIYLGTFIRGTKNRHLRRKIVK